MEGDPASSTGAEPDFPFVVDTSLNEVDSPALRFSSHQDALDYARHSVEQSRREMMGNCWLPVVEAYVNGHCHLVMTLVSEISIKYFQLVFFAVPLAENGRSPADMDMEGARTG
jgi:hypothetical protein